MHRTIATMTLLMGALCAPPPASAGFEGREALERTCGAAWQEMERPLGVQLAAALEGGLEYITVHPGGSVTLGTALFDGGASLAALPPDTLAVVALLGPPLATGSRVTAKCRSRAVGDDPWVEVQWVDDGGGRGETAVTLRIEPTERGGSSAVALTIAYDRCGPRVTRPPAADGIGVRVSGAADPVLLSSTGGLKCDASHSPALDARFLLPAPPRDVDRDLVANSADNCPKTPNLTQENTDRRLRTENADVLGDDRGDACDCDADGDGVRERGYESAPDDECDAARGPDNCPLVHNPRPRGRDDTLLRQPDADGDEVGDACDSDDDGDGVPDGDDNCPLVYNPDQRDTDLGRPRNPAGRIVPSDTRGDACDYDDDNDGTPDAEDGCPLVYEDKPIDTDGDGRGDACDPDDDGDSVIDAVDNCPLKPNSAQTDVDGDGKGDACDRDIDGDDETPDHCPYWADGRAAACAVDADGDGRPDDRDTCPEIADDLMRDKDRDGRGRACDDNDDGHLDNVLDVCDVDCQWMQPGGFEACRMGQAAPGRRLSDRCCIGGAALARRDHRAAWDQVCRPLGGDEGQNDPPTERTPVPRPDGPRP